MSGSQSVTVFFAAGAFDARVGMRAPTTKFTVKAIESDGVTVKATQYLKDEQVLNTDSSSMSAVVVGLTNGEAYTVSVTATNSAGGVMIVMRRAVTVE